MEEEKDIVKEKVDNNQIFLKILPYIICGLAILTIGFSMIGNFFMLREKVEGEKIYTIYKLGDVLFNNPFGTPIQTYLILIYLVFPLLACLFIDLRKLFKESITISVLLFLLSAISMILAKDVIVLSLTESLGLDIKIEETYFSYMLPIIGMFLASFLSLILGTNVIAFTTKDLAEMGILVAASVGLNFLKIVQIGGQGGSINFQMLPLFILALRRGPLKGFLGAGIAQGLITCLTDGWGIATYPFDYLVGIGSACILGFFSPLILGPNQKTYNFKGELFLFIGASAATLMRFIGSTASSIVIYGASFQFAVTYNAIYIPVSGAISIAVIMAIYGPFLKINRRYPVINEIKEVASK